MNIMVICAAPNKEGRSRNLALRCQTSLETLGAETTFVDLHDLNLPNFDNNEIFDSPVFQKLHADVLASDGLVLCSPVYNWGISSELKKFIEYIGATSPDRAQQGALFDKVVSFVNIGGLPHSYTAFREIATALMLDFKCIINPYNVYAHNRHWTEEGELDDKVSARIDKSMHVAKELCDRLAGRSYSSTWEI